MITIPLLIVIAIVLCLIPVAAYHLKASWSLKTDMLKGWLVGVWCAVAVVAIVVSL